MEILLEILHHGYWIATEHDVARRNTMDEGTSPWWLVVMLDRNVMVGAKWFHNETEADRFVLTWTNNNPNLYEGVLFPELVTG